ncbi:MAG: element excision factor XisI family protein [Bacteroidota bacterium]
MEKVTQYKEIVRKVLVEVARAGRKAEDPIQASVAADMKNGHFLAFFDGWRGTKRSYGIFIHVDVLPTGKVYLRHDGTDVIIAHKLEAAGIPKSDIVLAFHHPIQRPDTEYALA